MKIPLIYRRVGGRIFLTFATLLVAVTLALSFVTIKFAEQTVAESASNELRVLSIVLSRQVQRSLARIEQNMLAMGKHGFLVQEVSKEEPKREDVERFLQSRLELMPFFADLAAYNRQGECVGSTDKEWYAIAAKQKAFFTGGLRAFNFSDVFTSDEGKIQLVSSPINNGTSVRGVLVGQVNMDIIYELLDQKLALSESTDAFLVDSALRFITPGKTGIKKLLESHLVSTPLVKHLKEEFWVGKYKNYEGEEVLGTVMRVPGRQWYVVIEREFREVTKPVGEIKLVVLAATLGLIFSLLVVTYFLTRSITRPLTVLVDGARRIAQGDLARPVEVPRDLEEIAFLAEEFDKMRARIASFQENLLERLEVSERRRIESERLAAIGTLASTLAHEIRNPLNAMGLLLSRLEFAKVEADEATKSVIRSIRGEIGRLDRLVSDILDYARPLHLQLAPVNLCELIEATVAMYRGMLDAQGIRSFVKLPPAPVIVRGDSDKLKQCFVNILQNAIEAISAEKVQGELEIVLSASDGRATLKICDNGAGLPVQSATRLFDLFFTTKEKGTGLGLSTVRKIIDAHGGQVVVANRNPSEGKPGAEVMMTWPLLSQI